MGNPDLVIVFNNGEVSFLIKGQDYETREDAIKIGILKFYKYINDNKYISEIISILGKKDVLSIDIKSINLYEVYDA